MFDLLGDTAKVIAKMDMNTAGRVIKGIIGLPNRGDIKRLEGDLEGKLRLRVGDWRILFKVQGEIINITDIEPRGDVYK
ncbi:hypothetical protein FACS1894217_09460 [Clostridia bacterium]|nr:hypothetical protein FACS1894217_09460 [Clostridia bacterium]